MASSNKTQNLGLNVWAATDPVLRDDFNADNQRLDTALGSVINLPGLYYASGTWVGDNQSVGPGQPKPNVSLAFNFEPLIVFIDYADISPQANYRAGTILRNPATMAPAATAADTYATVHLVVTWGSTSVSWYGTSPQAQYSFNLANTTYVYQVIGRKT